MTRICEWCGESIALCDSRTSSGNSVWHTRCWNHAVEQRAAYIAECEDSEGFARRPLPDELPMSETESIRSEVIPIMATAASNPRAPREVVEFPPNAAVTVALKYPHAKTVSSQHGERFMFSLADGRVMFLDPEVGGKIEALGINVCENFTITRKWDEQKSLSTWEVARLAGEQPNGTLVVPSAGENENKVSPKPPASAPASNGTDHRKAAPEGRRHSVDRRDQRSGRRLRADSGSDPQHVSRPHQAGRSALASSHRLYPAIEAVVCRVADSTHLADALPSEARPPPQPCSLDKTCRRTLLT
jgi:hypothetical protein